VRQPLSAGQQAAMFHLGDAQFTVVSCTVMGSACACRITAGHREGTSQANRHRLLGRISQILLLCVNAVQEEKDSYI
jgi:hypothetical protein